MDTRSPTESESISANTSSKIQQNFPIKSSKEPRPTPNTSIKIADKFPTENPPINILKDSFGSYIPQDSHQPNTPLQARINVAFENVETKLARLQEYVKGLENRGVHSDSAITWYIDGWPRRHLGSDMQKAWEEIEGALRDLTRSMWEASRSGDSEQLKAEGKKLLEEEERK